MKNIARILYTLIASVMLLVLIIILIFIIVKVVPSYTESADRTVNAVSSLIRKDSYTPEDVNFIVALEYESLSTRLVVTQILAGLTIGLCICIIGLMLFGLGEYQEALRIELQKTLETKPFSLICNGCDNDGPESYTKAIAEGWTEIAPDDGMSWNFLGYCPDCSNSA